MWVSGWLCVCCACVCGLAKLSLIMCAAVLCGQQGEPPSEQDIASALEQTRHALCDLSALINSNSAVTKATR